MTRPSKTGSTEGNKESIGGRLDALLKAAGADARELSGVTGLSEVAISNLRTNKTRYPKDETLDAIVDFFRSKGVVTTAGYLRSGIGAAPARQEQSRSYTMDDIRRLAALHNARQQAPDATASELKSLHGSLYAAVRSLVTASAPEDADDELLDVLTESFVERFTRPSMGRRESAAHPQAATGHPHKRRT